MEGTVLIADDDKNLRNILTQALTRAGAKVRATATLSTLWRWLEEGEGDVVLTDVNLADGDALEILAKMKAKRPDLEFVVMSAQNTVLTAIRATEVGAFDYLAKPFDLREMLQVLQKAQGQSQKSRPENTHANESSKLPIIGRSDAMQEIYKQLSRIIPADLNVLIQGSAGTGKSLIAKIIHDFGPRKEKPFVKFGGEDSSFDAIKNAFVRAQNGTLVFESIDEFFANEQRQIQLLIDSGEYPCQIISTTNKNLGALARSNQFREDLYFRTSVLGLALPDLVDRDDDVIEIANHFLALANPVRPKILSQAAIEKLRTQEWAGNIYELKSNIERALAMSNMEIISDTDLESELTQHTGDENMHIAGSSFGDIVEAHVKRFLKLHGDQLPAEGLYQAIINEVERPLLRVVLDACDGNQIKASNMLDINRNTLRKKINTLDISVTKSKKMM